MPRSSTSCSSRQGVIATPWPAIEIDRIRRIGEIQRFPPYKYIFVTGEISPGMFVIIKGSVKREPARSPRAPRAHHRAGPGEFLAEVAQLSGRPALVDAQAVSDVRVTPGHVSQVAADDRRGRDRRTNPAGAHLAPRGAHGTRRRGGPVFIGEESDPNE